MKKDLHEFYLELSEICLANTEQFSNDAILLRDNGSFGHAYSLAVLGFEELAKTWIFFDLYLGITINTDEIVDFIQWDHKTKQLYLWNMFANLIRLEWLKVTQYRKEIAEINENIPEKEAERIIRQFIKKDCDNIENNDLANIASTLLQSEDVLNQLNADQKLMEKKKKKGFYVDFDIKNQKIKNDPLKFPENPIFIETLSGFVNYTKIFFTSLKENIDNPQLQTFVHGSKKFMEKIRLLEKSNEENKN